MGGKQLITLHWIHSVQSSRSRQWTSIDSSHPTQAIRFNQILRCNGCPATHHIPFKPFDSIKSLEAMDVHQLITSHSNHSIQSIRPMQWTSSNSPHPIQSIQFIQVTQGNRLLKIPHNPLTQLDPINSHNAMDVQ